MDCAICINKTVPPFKTLPCNHTFCSPCINNWKKKHNTCPLCRNEFIVSTLHVERHDPTLELLRDLISKMGGDLTHEFLVKIKNNLLFNLIAINSSEISYSYLRRCLGISLVSKVESKLGRHFMDYVYEVIYRML